MAGLVFNETLGLGNRAFVVTKMKVTANNQAILLKSSRVDSYNIEQERVSVYLTDGEVDDLIVLLTYYKTNKIAQGHEWKEAKPNGND